MAKPNEPIYLDEIKQSGVSVDALEAAEQLAHTKLGDFLEAKSIELATKVLVDTSAIGSMASAISHGHNPLTTEGRNATRYELAVEGIRELLKQNGVSNISQHDLNELMNISVTQARETMDRRNGIHTVQMGGQ